MTEVQRGPDLGHGTPIAVFREQMDDLAPQAQLSHTGHTLSYTAKGTISLEHGGALTIPAGSVTIVPAGAPYRLLGGRDVDVWVADFCAPCVGLDESKSLMRPFRRVRMGALPIIAISTFRQQRLISIFRDLEEEIQSTSSDAPELARCLLKLLLGEVCRALTPGQTGTAAGSLASDALSFIQQRCFEPISLKEVAEAVHRTPAHVATTVKTATGFSVGRWIAAGKTAEAASRLAHTDDDLDSIALHVGWQDKTHLIRQFKKFYGVTPAAWRSAERAKHARVPDHRS